MGLRILPERFESHLNGYLIYFPDGGESRIGLRRTEGNYSVEWFIPLTNRTVVGPKPVRIPGQPNLNVKRLHHLLF